MSYLAPVPGRVALTSFVILSLLLAGNAATAVAAELRWRAPPGCPREEDLTRDIEAQIGRPLTEVQDIDFEAVVESDADGRFQLALRMVPRSAALEPNARRIAAASCQELSGAAVVAIAMALAERETRAPEAAAANTPVSTPAAPEPVRTERPPLRYGAGLGALIDVGALPKLALGGELEVWLGYRALRVAALGALFQAQDARVAGETGTGTIRLALGGLLVCFEWIRAPFGFLGCGGYELGKMRGEGAGVMQPERGNALWNALRGELGLDVRFASYVALVTRAGLSIPLARPEFELAGQPLHKPAAASFRAQLGLMFLFSSADRSGAGRRQTGQ